MRLWYLRRAVPWPAVGVGCAVAAALVVVAYRWPGTAGFTLPFALAACASAAAFVLDELAAPVVVVTPRGQRWRPASRYAVVALPVAVWAGLTTWLPEATRGEALGWLLAGLSACLLTVGAAATVAGAGTPRPGALLVVAVVLLTAGPLVVGPFLGLTAPYPFPGAGQWVTWFWGGAGVIGLALLATPWVRPPVRG